MSVCLQPPTAGGFYEQEHRTNRSDFLCDLLKFNLLGDTGWDAVHHRKSISATRAVFAGQFDYFVRCQLAFGFDRLFDNPAEAPGDPFSRFRFISCAHSISESPLMLTALLLVGSDCDAANLESR